MKVKYSNEKIQQFINKIQRTQKPCPFCGGMVWWGNNNFQGYVNVFPQVDEKCQQTGNVFPAFLLSCEQCGYTHVFSAVFAKVLED